MAGRLLLTLAIPFALLAASIPAQAGSESSATPQASHPSPPQSRPFSGIRYFNVPSQNRYRAVKSSPRSPNRPPGYSSGAYSKGPGGASCLNDCVAAGIDRNG